MEEVNPVKIAICEDDIVQLGHLKDMIERCSLDMDFEIALFASGEELAAAYEKGRRFEILFLDMRLKDLDGIQTAEIIRQYGGSCSIIITTSVLEYAIDGYRINALDFLLKPIAQDKLENALLRAVHLVQAKEDPTYTIETRDNTIVLKAADILYVESNGRKVRIHCDEETHVSHDSLKDVQNKLLHKGFVRISRYYLVNLRKIKKINTDHVLLAGGGSLYTGESYRKELKKKYMTFMLEDPL